MIAVPRTEPEEDDFEDTSVVPPTLFVGAWTPPVRNECRALAVPPSLVAEALA